jgi:hypothetical protein
MPSRGLAGRGGGEANAPTILGRYSISPSMSIVKDKMLSPPKTQTIILIM